MGPGLISLEPFPRRVLSWELLREVLSSGGPIVAKGSYGVIN